MNVIDRIISVSLRHRYLVMVLTIMVVGVGIYCFRQTPVDAFPDVTQTKVTIITQWPGRSAEEIEKLVSIPIEIAMNSVQQKTDIRSTTLFGLSVVTVMFDDKAESEYARQQVYNLLADVDLPEGVRPEVQPLSGPTGEIYRYTLRSSKHSISELKTIQDWTIERRLRSVPGVADIVSFGGEVKTYEVSADPYRLLQYDISVIDLYEALAESNVNVGGDIIEHRGEAYVVRGIGVLNNVEEIGNVVITTRGEVPILVKQVAKISEGVRPRLGQVGRGEENDVVEGIVVMRRGENSEKVIAALKAKLEEVQQELSEEIEIVPFYDREDLVRLAERTVLHNVLEGIVLVSLVVLLFMRDWRTTVIVSVVIPVSLLFAFICLKICGMSANLLSLGAIDFGIIIDGAVVMVEGIYVMLTRRAQQMGQRNYARWSKRGAIRATAAEKARSIVFAKLIIILALLPIFSFQKVEGKMFSPLAYTLSFALAGALLSTLTLVPALSSTLLERDVREHRNRFLNIVNRSCDRIFCWLHKRKRIVIPVGSILIVGGLTIYYMLGTEFLPQMDEGSVYVRATMPPSVSLNESVRMADALRGELLTFQDVQEVITQSGRPNDGTDATGFYNIELFVKLRPKGEWREYRSKEAMVEAMQTKLQECSSKIGGWGEGWQGIDFNFSQPISDNVEEAVSGVKGAIVAKVFGPDLNKVEGIANQVERVMSTVRGITDLGVLRNIGQPELRIELDESRLARYGVDKEIVQHTIEMAIGGKAATQVYEGERKFDLILRYDSAYRNSVEKIGRILVPSRGGVRIPISELATIETITGPLIIYRENHERYCAVKFSVRDRDMGSAVREARAAVQAAIMMPQGYHIEWSGDFENQQRASHRLAQIVPISLLLIYLLLIVLFGNGMDAAMVLTSVPAAAVGGLMALLLTGFNFSISAGIGFICLFGICIQNGVIMLTDIRHNIYLKYSVTESVRAAMRGRVRAILMTAMMATLGLLPAALSSGIGSESQRPLAIVIIGGLVTATLYILFLFPLIVEQIYLFRDSKRRIRNL